MKSHSLTPEKASEFLKTFSRIQTCCIQIIKMKNKLGAHHVRDTQLSGIPFSLELQFSSFSINSHNQRLLCHGFAIHQLLGECPDMRQENDKSYPYPKRAFSSRTNR